MDFVIFLRNKIEHIITWHITYPIDKIVNTLIWLLTPKDKVLVLNVWLRHRGNKVRSVNLGDDLNYAVVSYFSKKRIISYMHSYISLFKPQNYMCIGSIVDTLTNSQSIIWGSGAMYGDKDRECVKPKKVLAVRGPLTREYLLSKGVSCPEVYGDPAILLSLVYPCNNTPKKYKIGLIPHYVDYNCQNIVDLKRTYSNKVTIINVAKYKQWQDVIKQINECEYIVSSSLHGLIIANSYGIPCLWVKLSNSIKGNDFKFYDYFGGIGLKNIRPIELIDKTIELTALIEIIKRNQINISFDAVNYIKHCPFN